MQKLRSLVPSLNRITKRFASISSNEELSFAVITPKSIAKGHTGGIIARLLSTPGLRIVGARMYEPSENFKNELVEAMREASNEDGFTEKYEEAMTKYLEVGLSNQGCAKLGINNRIMVLLFAGKDTRQKLSKIVGDNIPPPEEYGRTIRGTYGDYQRLPSGEIVTFEPAVLISHTPKSNRKKLEIFAKYAEPDGGVMKPKYTHYKGIPVETGMVMIKPDNFERPSSLPGHILDLFGTTGLHIVGTKVFSMTLSKAYEFYGFLEKVFENKQRDRVEGLIRSRLQGAFDFEIRPDQISSMYDIIKHDFASTEVSKIITYMTGIDRKLQEYTFKKHPDEPGPATCFAVLYRGPKAIEILRTKLGSTDPTKAEAGTIRSDYGHDLMRNSAHASDSLESCDRERRIIGLMGTEPSEEKKLIESWLKSTS